jgi:hypothetical protein
MYNRLEIAKPARQPLVKSPLDINNELKPNNDPLIRQRANQAWKSEACAAGGVGGARFWKAVVLLIF